MLITLIGYRGTGKTTIAPRLAQRLKFDWIDADIELERIAGRSIRDIFATDGEPEFRRLERENLVRLLKRNRLVLATGGGAILNDATRLDLRGAGPVVWLKASVEAISKRILVDGGAFANRPNLTTGGGIDEIRTLVAQREPLYQECATISVPTDSLPIDSVVEQILNQLPANYRQETNA
ncbi:shikimate kinase [Schlesneria paludicola]|uniref:shikimate kinase n=1 Tax=Schlesneria paludicola TaxID=360056 RepID=UPI00029A4CB8|nr:shikimate kinase [Schlesneria paludicola]